MMMIMEGRIQRQLNCVCQRAFRYLTQRFNTLIVNSNPTAEDDTMSSYLKFPLLHKKNVT